jgi:hypothetical protein
MTTGSGIHDSSGVPFARAGFAAAARAAVAGERVDFYEFFESTAAENDWVGIGDAEATSDPKSINHSSRHIDETITLEINIGAFRPGRTEDVAKAAWERATALLELIAVHIASDVTLDGAVLWCLPGNTAVVLADTERGFQAEVAATFTCSHRVRASISRRGTV